MANLLSPLSAHEISTLLGGISDAAAHVGDPGAGSRAVNATIKGLRTFCGKNEVNLAVIELIGLTPADARDFAGN